MLVGGLGIAGYAWRVEPHWIEVVHRQLAIAGLPDAWVGRTLVLISDLHIGPVVDDDYLIGALERVAALAPDVVAVTGDFMTYRGPEQFDQVARVLEHLQPGRLATVGVLGNHDFGLQWSDVVVAERLARRVQEAGVNLLRNASFMFEGLALAGLDDCWSPTFAPQKVLPTLPPGHAALVLCHNPDVADLPVWAGFRGWILCGHTHGGQCKPPFFKPPLLPVSNPRYVAGEIDLQDGRRLYINRGLGYLRRVRFNVRPEITVFTLGRSM
jgi:predicted MPP superfamily phosphohydrolase